MVCQEFNSHTSILTKRCVGINMVWATAHSIVMLPGQQILQKCYEPSAYNAHLLKNTMHPFNLYLHRKLWGERRDLRIWYECCWWGKNTEQRMEFHPLPLFSLKSVVFFWWCLCSFLLTEHVFSENYSWHGVVYCDLQRVSCCMVIVPFPHGDVFLPPCSL